VRPDQVELYRRDYFANGGWETFLSYEDPVQVFPPALESSALRAPLCARCCAVWRVSVRVCACPLPLLL